MWNVLVIEEFVVFCRVFYYFIAYHFSITHSSLTSCKFMFCIFAKSRGCPKNKNTLLTGESNLFATFEQVFEHDVQGFKDDKWKKLPSHCFC